MDEIWKNIINYEELYQISNMGRIKSLLKILKPAKNKGGYLRICLCKNKIKKNFSIHRLVATHFILNPLNLPEVNHKKGIKIDNRASELEWCTSRENIVHSYKELNRKGSQFGKFGKSHNTSKKIVQLDLNNKFLRTFNTIKEAYDYLNKKTGGAISKCCNHCVGYKTYKGYKWEYYNNYIKLNNLENMNHLTRNNETPFDKVEELMECPHCLGSKEEFETTDEGITGDMIPCRVCDGLGEIPRQDDYTREEDYLDDEADSREEDNYFLED